ncbi:6-carboxy-5,6,7,8-tetrahydropterin synthase [hydrothermal vent metagenome]|uniref:6-carboxy-5,6,7,8-tetrahydropterin synthase n=1 Tax=hydrothermal vent metagenome TaxID=652676 RepID=A0A3B1A629_9ZZZZ
MAALYTLKITLDFAAAHSLRDYPGNCSRLHGHNWKVEAEVVATHLNDVGMGVDFKTIRTATREIAERLDHQNLNDISPFDKINPTAENIAAYFYNELAKILNDDRVKVSSITIWETERASVRYSEN